MKILLTGTSSGLGHALAKILQHEHDIDCLTRIDLDLSNINNVLNYEIKDYDILIHCAGTDIGGKISFVEHDCQFVSDILTTNLLAPITLTNKILKINSACKIVCVTSTNNKHYYANDLAYSLSKSSLSMFLKMLTVDYPKLKYLEIQLGLTKTNFNKNRYKHNRDRFVDIYTNPCLDVDYVAEQIKQVLFNDHIKFIEISP